MGMSTYVVGIKDPEESDGNEDKFLEIYDLCKELNIAAPIEVYEFVSKHEDAEDDDGEIDLKSISREWSDDNCSMVGIEITVEDIPKDIKIIRFVNSY